MRKADLRRIVWVVDCGLLCCGLSDFNLRDDGVREAMSRSCGDSEQTPIQKGIRIHRIPRAVGGEVEDSIAEAS
jgi:hypothetical protein